VLAQPVDVELLPGHLLAQGNQLAQLRLDVAAVPLEILAAGSRSTEQVADGVYGGTVPDALRDVVVGAARAYLDYLLRAGLIARANGLWMTVPS